MGCGIDIVKCLLFVYNFLLALCGIGLIAQGIMTRSSVSSYEGALGKVSSPSMSLMLLGGLLLAISLFGCLGTMRENKCLTATFACMLLVMLLIHVAASIYAVKSLKDISKQDIETEYSKTFKNYWTKPEAKTLVDTVQTAFSCCGVKSYEDFTGMYNGTIPASCCNPNEPGVCIANNAHKSGCATKIYEFLSAMGTAIGGITFIVVLIEAVGVAFALCFISAIRDVDRRGYRV